MMKTELSNLVNWLNRTLRIDEFDDVANNGLQLERTGGSIGTVAFAVDASLRSVEAAARAKAELLVVHHGLSWRGGIRTVTGGVYQVIRAAIEAKLAIYAAHLPLDAHEQYGNNFCLARHLGLTRLNRAFRYRGNAIGVTGYNRQGCKIGICSGGAGAFAAEAQTLGCKVFVTGEADWSERIAAENIGMPMITAGHYATETFGVDALAKAVRRRFKLKVVSLTKELA